MLRTTILVLSLSCAWPIAHAVPKPTPLPAQSVQYVEKLMADKQLDEATKSIRALIKIDPGNARMHYYLAQIHAFNNDWDNAAAMLKKAKYFDWRLKFASNKERVAELEQRIKERKDTPKFYVYTKDTVGYREFILSEKRSYAPITALTEKRTDAVVKTPEHKSEHKPQRRVIWFFVIGLGLIGFALIYMVRRFNIQNTRLNIRLSDAAVKEQKIVLLDLMRVLNDLEAITKSENLNDVHNEITDLLEWVQKRMSKLEEKELQRIEDIEHYVRKTQLYRRYCNNFQALPPVA